MTGKASKRAYYRITFELLAPLSIGAADSVETDSDVVLDGSGHPFIPATSIAGVYRSYFSVEEAGIYFGKQLDGGSHDISESVVRVYDGVWDAASNGMVSIRDNVALKNKVAVPGAKFDRQIVERGSRFTTYIEVRDLDQCPIDRIEEMLGAVHTGGLSFGAKTTRGFGRVKLAALWKREFDLDDAQDCSDWLDFKMFENAAWRKSDVVDADSLPDTTQSAIWLKLDLEQCGALSIREYSTVPGMPDFGQLYIRGQQDAKGGDVPVIPGTSWAGAFRERYQSFSSEGAACKLFGYVEPSQEGGVSVRKSRIAFSESVVSGGGWKEITRNSIDRFTGGTKDGALFGLRTYYAGKTELDIRIELKGEEWVADDIAPLLAAVRDLHLGFMPIGGLTAVGHGIFRIADAELAVGGKSYAGFYQKAVETAGAEPDFRAIAEDIVGYIPSGATQRGKEGEND